MKLGSFNLKPGAREKVEESKNGGEVEGNEKAL